MKKFEIVSGLHEHVSICAIFCSRYELTKLRKQAFVLLLVILEEIGFQKHRFHTPTRTVNKTLTKSRRLKMLTCH